MLKIVCSDIKKFILQRKFIFSVLILSLIITSFTFSLFVADRMQIVNTVSTVNNATNKYYVGDKNGINKDKIEKLENWLKTNEFIGYKINLYSDILLRTDIDTIIFQEEQIPTEELAKGAIGGVRVKRVEGVIEKPYNILIGTNNNESRQISFIGRIINENDLKNQSNYIMIDYNSSMSKKNPFILNDTIIIRDKEYTVQAISGINIYPNIFEFSNAHNYNKGTLLNLEPVVIPITTFLNGANMICGIDIIIPENIAIEKKENFTNFITNNFNESTILEPQKIENAKLSDISKYIMIYSILIILALINILALFIYWIDINWRKYMIYRICGANKKDIFKIILLEAIIIAAIAIFIGNVLYYIIAIILNNMMLNLKDIFTIQFIILFLIMILISIEGLRILRINPRYMERR